MVILGGCTKDINAPTAANRGASGRELSSAAVTVSGIAPASGVIYTAITISGSNFDTVKTNNVVKINGVAALVNSATATQLVVTVLSGSATGAVTVTTGGASATAPTAFKVLNLVKTGSINQPAGDTIEALGFDKSGNTYAIQNLASGHWAISKYTGGKLNMLYQTPDGITTNGINGYHNAYSFTFKGLVSDVQGNIYTSLIELNESYSVNKHFDPIDNTYTYRSYILKITPAGHVTELADSVNSRALRFVDDMAIDANGNIFVAEDYSETAPNDGTIDKIIPAGGTSIFYTNSDINSGIYNVAVDKWNNIYDLQSTNNASGYSIIQKFTPGGSASLIGTLSASYTDINNSMFFDPSNNIMLLNGESSYNQSTGNYYMYDASIVNVAGYISNNYRIEGYGPYDYTWVNISSDGAGNVYFVNSVNITKYSLQ
jgi:hypothetical protein